MSKSTSPDIVIKFGTGSPLTDISRFVMNDVAMGHEGIIVDGTAYGHTSKVNQPVGITDQPDIPLEGFYDDANNAPHHLFGTISGVNTPAYTLQVTWTAVSPVSSSSLPVHIKDFKILGKVKDVTRYRVVLTQAGPTTHLRQGA